MKALTITQFGNPVLRQKARQLTHEEIASPVTQELIANMRHTLISKQLGIALAAPQVNRGIALLVIAIRPTKHRPKVTEADFTMINPVITAHIGEPAPLWEGCISGGKGGAGLFAKVPRYPQVTVTYLDEHGRGQTKTLKGLPAQAVQHEVDHLQGVLFVDRVKDPQTFMTMQEYRKRITSK